MSAIKADKPDMAHRSVHVCCCLGLAAALGTACLRAQGVVESFPVQHREGITIRVLNGATGAPLTHLRLALGGGYTAADIEHRLWGNEAATDAAGEARQPFALRDLPFLQVRPANEKLCQDSSRGETYNVSQIRNEGLNAPNHCGFVPIAAIPGTLVVFVRGSAGAEVPQQVRRKMPGDVATDAHAPAELRPKPLDRAAILDVKSADASVQAGLALAGIAARVSRGQAEASANWALLGSGNEIDALVWGTGQPAGWATTGTEELTEPYDGMCRSED